MFEPWPVINSTHNNLQSHLIYPPTPHLLLAATPVMAANRSPISSQSEKASTMFYFKNPSHHLLLLIFACPFLGPRRPLPLPTHKTKSDFIFLHPINHVDSIIEFRAQMENVLWRKFIVVNTSYRVVVLLLLLPHHRQPLLLAAAADRFGVGVR